MISALLAQAADWQSPTIDWHALAPELVLIVGINLVLFIDLWIDESRKWAMATLTGFVLLGAFLPTVTLAVIGDDSRSMFDGRYVVDEYSLILKALFLLVAYVVVLMSQTELEEGGYYQGEFYVLLLCSVLGMVMMTSSRDLVSIFVALELLSIPAYMLAAWRKRDAKSNEAGVKYYLLGVFASGVMLYGMSFLFGVTGSTKLTDIGASLAEADEIIGLQVLAVVFTIVGFAFKVSAVPFHTWAPDTYEGAPTPVTAFLSVASKAAGFVALCTLIFIAFPAMSDTFEPLLWVLSALTMTVGNVVALRQTNIVRMLAYSSVSQGGFILMPLAVAGTADPGLALNAVVVYLLVYAFTNLGAFAVVIAAARKTRSGEIASFGGMFAYAPGLTVLMTIFLASLAGIPPLGGWFAKFNAFRAVLDAGTTAAYVLAVIGAINTVIAVGYYMRVLRVMWMAEVPDGDTAPVVTPPPVAAALGITAIGTLVLGILPAAVARFGELNDLTGALGR
jgi:NADH-quinone oxidoreductase subunit N